MTSIYGIEVSRIAKDANGNGRYLVQGIDEEVARSLGGRKGRSGSRHEGGWIFQASHTQSGERELIAMLIGAFSFKISTLGRGRA